MMVAERKPENDFKGPPKFWASKFKTDNQKSHIKISPSQSP